MWPKLKSFCYKEISAMVENSIAYKSFEYF